MAHQKENKGERRVKSGETKLLTTRKKTKERLKEIFRFAVAGGIGFLVDFGILVMLVETISMNEILAAAISFTVSVIVNYIICIMWVFDAADKKNVRTITIFGLSSLVGLGLNELIMWILIDIITVHYMISKVIATILVMIWNYIAKRKAVTMQR